MFRRRSIKITHSIKNNTHSAKTKSEHNSHKWLKLFLSGLIPLMIGIFTVVITVLQQKLSIQQREQDKQDALLLRQQSERQADNLQKETAFATYLDDVSKLLLLENQAKSSIHIRMKTLTTLRQLDPERKKDLFLFLYESELIYRYPLQPYTSLLKLTDADFNGVYFEGTIETKCSLSYLYLYGVYLSNSSFINCYIDRSNFSSTTMYKALFFNTLLTRTGFKFTFLDQTNFSNTKFYETIFLGASLVECDFTGSLWREDKVDFTNANLSGAILSNEQLRNSILFNSFLPNGTWGPIRTDNLVVNGDAEQNCSTNGPSILNGWNVQTTGDVRAFAYRDENGTENFGKCYFRATSFYTSINAVAVYQFVDLKNFSLLISNNIARYDASVDFQCFGNQYAYMEIRFIDRSGFRSEGIDKATRDGSHIQSLKMSAIIYPDVDSVQILIAFVTPRTTNDTDGAIEKHYCICDNVRFSITKA